MMFLPPNTTATCQPMDAGVIHCHKAHYRSNLARACLVAFEDKCEFSVDVKYGMELLKNLGQLCPKVQSETASEKLALLHLVMKVSFNTV